VNLLIDVRFQISHPVTHGTTADPNEWNACACPAITFQKCFAYA